MSDILVLNKSWLAVNTCSDHKALKLAFKERARIVDPDPWDSESGKSAFTTYDLFGWIDRGVFPNKPTMDLHGKKVQVPRIIVLNDFSKPPLQVVKYCRRNLWIRDCYRCQFCGKIPAKDDLTIDHVLPKSRGGISSFINTVLACSACNRKKDDRTPEEAGMKLRRYSKNSEGILVPVYYDRPKKPAWSPVYAVKRREIYPEWNSFVQDVVSELYWETPLEP